MTDGALTAKAREELALVRQALLASATVQAAVEDRVRTDHVNDPDVGSVVHPLLILERIGGAGRYQGTVRDVVFDLYAYSNRGSDDALRVYDIAYPVIQAKRLVATDRTVMYASGYCMETARPETGYNERTRSWYARGSWLAKIAG